MKKNFKRVSILLIVSVFLVALNSASAFRLPDLKKTVKQGLKAAGIGALIKQFGPELNKRINQVFSDKSVPNVEDTKVVPIFTFGKGVDAGACQVTGPADKVRQVQAVYAIESSLNRSHKFNF